jgi:SH3-like domain-containing protein
LYGTIHGLYFFAVQAGLTLNYEGCGIPYQEGSPMHLKVPTFDSKTPILHAARTATGTAARSMFKSILAFSFLFIISTVHAREMASVDAATLNVRAGSGTKHPIVWELIRGYPLVVIGQKGNWLNVRDFENDEGWVYRPLIGKAPHHIVKSKIANLRSAPNTKSRIVAKTRYGDVFRTVEKRNGWIEVEDESGLKGWIARRLLWGW